MRTRMLTPLLMLSYLTFSPLPRQALADTSDDALFSESAAFSGSYAERAATVLEHRLQEEGYKVLVADTDITEELEEAFDDDGHLTNQTISLGDKDGTRFALTFPDTFDGEDSDTVWLSVFSHGVVLRTWTLDLDLDDQGDLLVVFHGLDGETGGEFAVRPGEEGGFELLPEGHDSFKVLVADTDIAEDSGELVLVLLDATEEVIEQGGD